MTTTLSSVSIDQFLNSLSENGHGSNTIRAYRADLKGLLTWMENQEPADLETLTARYLNAHRAKWAPKTTIRKLGTFRVWAKWMGIPEFLAAYKPPTPDKARPHPIEEGIPAITAMIEASGTNDQRRALVALCGLCGLRLHEALAVRPKDIDYERRTLSVRGKGDKSRTVPISEQAWESIMPAVGAAVIYETTLVNLKDRWARQVLTSLARRAGVARAVSSHDLRATLATAAYTQSKDLRAVQELLGHSSSVTTELYTGITSAAMRAAVEGL